MKSLPATTDALVLRTGFQNDAAWELICVEIEAPQGDYQALVSFINDRSFDGATVAQLTEAAAQDNSRLFMFAVDAFTFSHPDRPILVLDLADEPGRAFRVIASEMWSVENILSIANMDFSDFANSVDSDGIFRGFPQ